MSLAPLLYVEVIYPRFLRGALQGWLGLVKLSVQLLSGALWLSQKLRHCQYTVLQPYNKLRLGISYLRPQLSSPHLRLHIHNLLLLRKRQRPRDTQHQRARADNEECLAAKTKCAADGACGGVDDVGHHGAGGRWDDVAEGEEAVGERLVQGGEDALVVGGDLGV